MTISTEGYVMEFYSFGTGETDVPTDKEIVGGKAASLSLMTNMGLAVPPGFIIPISMCQNYWSPTTKQVKFVNDIVYEATPHLNKMEDHFGYDPLLSVRSGAPVSMPGMMDTILNVGLNLHNIGDWEQRLGARATWDSYRRLILMLSTTGYDLEEKLMNGPLEQVKEDKGYDADTDLTVEDLKIVCDGMLKTFKVHKGFEFPTNLDDQLFVAIDAVFRSWNSERAKVYRKINKLEHVTGTAVTIQAMVFGNMNDISGTGVLFTANPLTGEPGMYGEYLINAQGEDVVAGIRTPEPIQSMKDSNDPAWAELHGELEYVCNVLENHYNDMVDIEFTVQDGVLYVLQSRVGKRSAAAAIRIATDMLQAGDITRQQMFGRITRSQYKTTKRPSVDQAFKGEPQFKGINASPGVATGYAVYSSKDAVAAAEKGDKVILVTHETTPDDIAGMNAAVGILTATGGSTSHAAVVARAMDKPCVCGVGHDLLPHLNGLDVSITICGSTGRVWIALDVPVIEGAGSQRKTLLDLVAEDAYQQVNLLETDENTLPQYCAVNVGMHVMLGVATDDIVLCIVGAQALNRSVLIDLNPMQIYKTKGLRTIFSSTDPMEQAYHQVLLQLIAQVKSGTLDPTTILVARGSEDILDALEKVGFIVVKEAKTLNDLLSGPATMSEGFIENVMGGAATADIVLNALKKAGVELKGAARDIHPEHVLFTLLAD
jgi:pyruvate,phosphate dikinase